MGSGRVFRGFGYGLLGILIAAGIFLEIVVLLNVFIFVLFIFCLFNFGYLKDLGKDFFDKVPDEDKTED
jgi:hypothetical protein